MRAQLVKRQIQTLNGVIESADQELQKNSGRGVAAIVETLDALAELLANFIKRHGVPCQTVRTQVGQEKTWTSRTLPAGSAIQVTTRSVSRPIYIRPACSNRSAQAMSELSSPSSRRSPVRAASSPAKISSQKKLPARIWPRMSAAW